MTNKNVDSIIKKDRIMMSVLSASVLAGFLYANGTFSMAAENAESVRESTISPTEKLIPKELSAYFGFNEHIEILVSPENTKTILEKEEFSNQKENFYSIKSDYLIKLESGDIFGFNPASGLIYSDQAINVKSASKPYQKLMSIMEAIDNIEKTSEILEGPKKKDVKKESSGEINSSKKAIEPANTAEPVNEERVKKVSEEEIQALISSKFEKEAFSNDKKVSGKDLIKNNGRNEQISSKDKLDDLEKLRMELKARVKQEFGDIPNANATINQHFGSNSGSSMQANSAQKSNVSDNQVNVQAIRETKNAVFYKNERIPKIGYDLNGNPITEDQKRAQVKGIMDRIVQMDDYWSVVYRAKGEEKKKIAVFSDPTCPYCKKLHEIVPELQQAGVTVYHLFYNRSMAPNTVSEPKVIQINEALENAWCSANPNEAIDSLYEGYAIPEADCSDVEGRIDFPGNEHYLMGRIIDMSGTPYTITEDGKVIPGFSIRGVSQPQAFLRDIGL